MCKEDKMRLRNIPEAKNAIIQSEYVIKNGNINWEEEFGNSKPINIEVGMGKGQFIIELAKRNSEINYIGIEKYTSVLFRALQKLEEGESINNLRFLCIDAETLEIFFKKEMVKKIYLNFSDPWPKERHSKRRLPSKQFLQRYDQILSKEGTIEFKTDNRKLFDFAVEEVKETKWNIKVITYDLHGDSILSKDNIMTEYEEKFSRKGNPIHKYIISR
jgi:tRNA (guanine-N7-)-methyltransferase